MNKFDWHTEPAFSRPASYNPNNGEVYYENRGISAWDYFAAAALQTMKHSPWTDNPLYWQGVARGAAEAADAMMLERATRSTDAHAEWQESLKPQSSIDSDQPK